MSFPDSNLGSFWPIFFKLCMDIDIREWSWIANELNLLINNRVMAIDWCKNVFFLHFFRTNGWILIKFCICIDKYKIHVVSNAHYFWSICYGPWSLLCSVSYELICGFRSDFVYAWYWQDIDLDDWIIFFSHFQKSYGPWLMLKFCLCSISCVHNWWILINFVIALILTNCRQGQLQMTLVTRKPVFGVSGQVRL